MEAVAKVWKPKQMDTGVNLEIEVAKISQEEVMKTTKIMENLLLGRVILLAQGLDLVIGLLF